MYQFPNSGVMIENANELPYHLIGAANVFLDTETTSGTPNEDSLNPWHHCDIAGIAFSVDDYTYYIPYINWNESERLAACDFVDKLLRNCHRWINHNIKYDMHVLQNSSNSRINVATMKCECVCTVVLAKLIDSDRIVRGGYGLDKLALHWCGMDIRRYEHSLQPYLGKNKDYGRIPADILGEYACEDIYANKAVYAHINGKLPDDCRDCAATEIKLTRNLFNLERVGLCVDKSELMVTQVKTLTRMIKIEEELEQLTGRPFNPASSDDCFDVFCNQYGLPILAYTIDQSTGEPTNNPSFNKHALEMYNSHPMSPKGLVPLVKEFRSLDILNNLFLKPWQELQRDGKLHSSYNQTVRTGRMSCNDPNAQQLNEAAKLLVHPKPGYVLISIDYSQIEFRTIVHYIEDANAIAAYKANPDVDFHQWVADMCGIKRKPAKTINFAIAFGEGKAKLFKQLSTDKSLVGAYLDVVDDMIKSGRLEECQRLEAFNSLAKTKTVEVFDSYLAALPNLKPTSYAVERVLKQRGYVRCLDGRHRHLPFALAYRGFNTVNQGSAAGIMKNRANALFEMIFGTPVEMLAIVHDEFLFQAPITDDETLAKTVRDLVIVMENNPFPMLVPLRCSAATSTHSWAKCKSIADGGNGAPVMYSPDDFNYLNHLR